MSSLPSVFWAGLVPLLLLLTGLYAAAPGSGYAILLATLIALSFGRRWRETPGRYLPATMLCGALLFNAIFLLHGLSMSLPARTYVVHVYSLLVFLMGFACARLAFDMTTDGGHRVRLIIGVAGLLGLLGSQLAQAANWLAAAPAPAQGFLVSLAFRPGGFLNPNLSAAIALILLYVAGVHRGAMRISSLALVLGLGAVVIALTQSRAALLALTVYAVWSLRRHPVGLPVVALSLAAMAWYAGLLDANSLVSDVVARFVARFSGDASSDERAWILREALRAMESAPWLGAGYEAFPARFGAGSHNTPLELMVSFGVVGAVPMLAAGALMLWPAGALLVVVCVLPSLLFSHNYFDSAPLQAALGIALASDRSWLRQGAEAVAAGGGSAGAASAAGVTADPSNINRQN